LLSALVSGWQLAYLSLLPWVWLMLLVRVLVLVLGWHLG
jgi:hypothetical protein